ncbi:glycosyltransferase [Vibrio vulnificus]|nr:glycosyltransferase [Vibrio vulnificus]
MNRKKPVIAMDLAVNGHGGGPFTSTTRIMNSKLKHEFDFKTINYDTNIGRSISLKRILDLKKQIEKIEPDIVHFTGLQLSGFHIAVACKLAGVKKTVITIRGMSGDSVYFNPLKKIILKYFIEPMTLALVDRFYCVSEYVSKRGIAKIFRSKNRGCIYNYPPVIEECNDRLLKREKLGISEEDFVVVSVARINKEKGYDYLESAIKKMSDYKSLKFIIVGDGSYKCEMERNLTPQVKDRKVIFTGKVNNVSYYNFISDAFVLPTLHETLSVALLEASCAKIPLVASNTGGIPEIVEDNWNGFLVPIKCSDSIVNAIMRLYENRELSRVFGERAYKKIEDKFDSDNISLKISKVYRELLEL